MKAIIDLGTNTFHILIAEVRNGVMFEFFKLQVPVKIGKGGINQNFINADAFERGMTALAEFRKYLDRFQITDIRAYATSAIRSARNGDEFVKQAKSKHQIGIEMISGETEAEYIYEGVRHSFNFPGENILVMDIGGGSIEFIVGKKDVLVWKHSFDLGAARLIEKFQPHDPINRDEIEALKKYFDQQLKHLGEALKLFPAKILVGSAGSFETLVDVVLKDLEVIPNALTKKAFEIRRQDFDVFCELMISSTKDQRSRLKGMVDFRIEMIVVAALLMKYVIETFGMERIIASDYSLKEGILFKAER